jgi:hypothetical protein
MADPLAEPSFSPRVAGDAAIGLIVALWPLLIGPEFPEPLAPEVAAEPAPPPAPGKPVGQAKARATMPAFGARTDQAIDREAFIASFRRQARNAALPCLLGFQPTPGSLLVGATLVKHSGRLSNLHAIGAGVSLPDCLPPAVAAMDFSPLVAPLMTDAQELQWRIDW